MYLCTSGTFRRSRAPCVMRFSGQSHSSGLRRGKARCGQRCRWRCRHSVCHCLGSLWITCVHRRDISGWETERYNRSQNLQIYSLRNREIKLSRPNPPWTFKFILSTSLLAGQRPTAQNNNIRSRIARISFTPLLTCYKHTTASSLLRREQVVQTSRTGSISPSKAIRSVVARHKPETSASHAKCIITCGSETCSLTISFEELDQDMGSTVP